MERKLIIKTAAILLAALGLATGLCPTANAASAQWVAAWKADPSGSTGEVPSGTQTLREIISPRRAGSLIRLHLTNRQGMSPVSFSRVWVGTQQTGAAVVAGSNRQVTFGGNTQLILQPGQDVLSDPLPYNVVASTKLAISMEAYGYNGIPTQSSTHSVSRETNYFSTVPTYSGGGAANESSAGFMPFTLTNGVTFQASWHYITGLDVQTMDPNARVVVGFGDSITDGLTVNPATDNTFIENLSNLGMEERYPDFLQRRFNSSDRYRSFTVVNAGIAGNRLTGGPFAPFFGPRALDRLNTDVLQVPGVTDVIAHFGINDIAFDNAAQISGDRTIGQTLIAGYKELITRLHASGVRIILGTIMPGKGAGAGSASPVLPGVGVAHGTDITDSIRLDVNAWIRTTGKSLADGVVDFDACMRDPKNTSYLSPAYNSGDNLHPTGAGYAAMANCVDLATLFP